jgi:hypothetical protein
VEYQGFIGGSNPSRSAVLDSERSMNVFPEISSSPAAKSRSMLVGTPGLQALWTLPVGPVWALWAPPNVGGSFGTGVLYALAGPLFINGASGTNNLHLYSINGSGTATDLGSIAYANTTGSGQTRQYPPILVGSDTQIMVAGGTNLMAYTPGSGWTTLSGGTPPQFVVPCAYLDGYFFTAQQGTLYASNLNDGTSWSGANVLGSEDGPARIVALANLRRELWVFDTQKITVYYDAGNQSFPLSRIPGAVIKVGCLAPRSVVEAQGSLFFLGAENLTEQNFAIPAQTIGAVYRTNGYNVERISSHGIEQIISGWVNPDQAMAWTYQEKGHTFYVLNAAPGNDPSDGCLVYDLATGVWHERANAWLANPNWYAGISYAHAFGKHLVGGINTASGLGILYEMKSTFYNDFFSGSQAIARWRTGPPIASENFWNFFDEFCLDCEVGTETSGTQNLTLSWSNDGGQTFNAGTTISIGGSGAYLVRARWLRLGKARERVFKVSTSDAMPIAWLQAFLKMRPGRS